MLEDPAKEIVAGVLNEMATKGRTSRTETATGFARPDVRDGPTAAHSTWDFESPSMTLECDIVDSIRCKKRPV